MMANINTRKGLALAALAGLGTTLITGAPAHAAANVALVPTEGTSFGMVAGQSLELTATASSEIPQSSWNTMKFKVTNVDGKAASVSTGQSVWGWDEDNYLTGDAGDSTIYDGFWGYNNNKIAIHSYDDDETSHYTVTAWLDADEDGVVDAGEYAQTQTVTFYKAADLNVTTTIESPIYTSDDEADVTVKINNINMDQSNYWWNEIDTDIWVQLNNGQGTELDWHWTSLSDGVYSATVHFGEAAGTILSAQAWWSNCSYLMCGYDDDQKIGAPATTQVLAHTVDYVDWSMEATLTSHTDGDVATNEAHKVVVTAYDEVDGDDVALAGKTVKIWVSSSEDLDSDETITINGVTYSANSSMPGQGTTAPLTATTDAKGQVVLNVSSAGLTDGDEVYYYAEAENNKYDYFTTYQEDRGYTAYLSNSDYNNYGVVPGGTVTVSAFVIDQFGALLPDGHNAVAERANDGAPWWNRSGADLADNGPLVYAPITSGKTMFSFKDSGTTTGQELFIFEVLKKDPTTGAYEEDPVTTKGFTVQFREAADTVPGFLDYLDCGGYCFQYNDDGIVVALGYGSEATPATVTTADFGNFDTRNVLGTAPSVYDYPTFGWTGKGVVGSVLSVTTPTHQGIGVSNAKVTINGPGLQFKVYSRDYDNSVLYSVYSTDTATTYTNATGGFEFVVWSHKSGLNEFTVSSGSFTQKFQFYVDGPDAYSATSLSLDAPAWTLPGKNVAWTATLKDKFGNLVDGPVNVKVSGLAGVNWNYNSSTDEDGTHTDNLSLGVNDTGVLNVTYSYDQNNDGDYTDATDLVVKKSILVQNGALVPADAKVAVSAPASSQNGRAVDVSVTVTTAAGVAIPGALVNLSGLGAGYLSATTATTDANGKVAVKLLAGEDEIGDAVVTATAGSVSATAKVSFGTTDANLNIAGKRVTADWSFAAGKRVVIYRDGVQIRNFVVSSDASDSFSFNLTKGKHTVKIKVGGVTIDSQSYNIK